MEIAPIETNYNGYRFRSRLEARWAVFFDEMGIKYEYEPEGYEMSNSDKYLPDFYLPNCNTYIEIKSIGAISISKGENRSAFFKDGREKSIKYEKFSKEISYGMNYMIAQGDPYESLATCITTTERKQESSSWLFFSPEAIWTQPFTNALGEKHRNLTKIFAINIEAFVNKKPFFYVNLLDDIVVPPKNSATFAIYTYGDFIPVNCNCDDIFRGAKETIRCAKLARQARFEYGEVGAVRG